MVKLIKNLWVYNPGKMYSLYQIGLFKFKIKYCLPTLVLLPKSPIYLSWDQMLTHNGVTNLAKYTHLEFSIVLSLNLCTQKNLWDQSNIYIPKICQDITWYYCILVNMIHNYISFKAVEVKYRTHKNLFTFYNNQSTVETQTSFLLCKVV